MTPYSFRHLALSLAVVIFLSSSRLTSGSRHVQTAMPEGASRVTFACDSSSWIKEDLHKVDTVLSLGTQLAGDVPGGVDKYRLAKEGKELTVLNLATSDSGVFKCKEYKYSLTVARNPTCTPVGARLREGVEQVFSCRHIFTNPSGGTTSTSTAPRVNWLVDDEIVLSKDPEEYMTTVSASDSAGEPATEALAGLWRGGCHGYIRRFD